MATLISNTALVYANHGRWIVDCPRPYCNSAFKVETHQTLFRCGGSGGCGMEAQVVWPPDADEIWEALNQRPIPSTRNWFPHGHDLAVRFNLPMGQTARQLIDEQKEMESYGNG